MTQLNQKVTFTNKGYNVADLNATKLLAIADISNAEKFNNLPHNNLVITNQDTASTLFVYLDDASDVESPDYVIFPSQTMVLNLDDGVSFSTIWIKNTHPANNIAAKAIKYKITTIKEVR